MKDEVSILQNEMVVASDLHKIKKLMREFQQISYSLKKFEERFSDIEFATTEDMTHYIRIAVAFKFDLEDSLKEFNAFYEKYKDANG